MKHNWVLFWLMILITVMFFSSGCKDVSETSSNVTVIEGMLGYKFDTVTEIGIREGSNYVFLDTCLMEDKVLRLPEVFADSLTINAVGEGAFSNNDRLETLIIPDCYTLISMFSFNYCQQLKTIEIGSGISLIEECAFLFCPEVENILVSEDNPYIYSENNCIFERETGTLLLGFSKSVIPESTKRIGRSAFRTAVGLETVDIPKNVETIEKWAFAECENLKSILIPISVTEMGEKVFYGCDGITIYCEAKERPSGWAENWLEGCENSTVIWGYSPQ